MLMHIVSTKSKLRYQQSKKTYSTVHRFLSNQRRHLRPLSTFSTIKAHQPLKAKMVARMDRGTSRNTKTHQCIILARIKQNPFVNHVNAYCFNQIQTTISAIKEDIFDCSPLSQQSKKTSSTIIYFLNNQSSLAPKG